MAPKATCPRCGMVYWGWALEHEKDPCCGRCGARLQVTRYPKETRTERR